MVDKTPDENELKNGGITNENKISSHWKRYGMIGMIGVLAFIGIGASFVIGVNNHGKNDNDALDLFTTLSSAGGFELKGTISGPLVDDGSVKPVHLYVFPSMEGFDKLNMELYATFERTDNEVYAVTMVDSSAYYTIHSSTGDLLVQHCMTNEDIVPVEKLTDSILDAVALLSSDVSNAVSDAMECQDGKLLAANWASNDYVYCVKNNAKTGDKFVQKIAGEYLKLDVTVMTDEAVEAARAQYIPTQLPTFVTVNGDLSTCSKLDFSGSSATDLSSLLHAYNRKLLGEDYQLKNPKARDAWYLKKKASPVNQAHVRRHLFEAKAAYTKEDMNGFTHSGFTSEMCDYYCDEYGVEVPIEQLDVGKADGFYRKLIDSTTQSVTLPRPCVFFTGSGYRAWWSFESDDYYPNNGHNGNGMSGWRRSAFEDTFFSASKSQIGIAPAHYGWGNIHKVTPCYCSSLLFTELDTYSLDWFSPELQTKTALTIAAVAANIGNPDTITAWPTLVYETMKQLDNLEKFPTIENVIVFTHYTSAMTVAAALDSGILEFGETAKWVTIHAPVEGASYTDPGADVRATLCKRDHIEFLIRHHGLSHSFENMRKIKMTGGTSIGEIIEACAPAIDETSQRRFVASLDPDSYPEDVLAVYHGAQSQLVKVNAALCGTSKKGFLSPNSVLNEYTAQLGFGGSDDESDGITPFSSCLAIASLKNQYAPAGEEPVVFETDPNSNFYASAMHNRDVEHYQDCLVDGQCKYQSWVNSLTLHVDYGAGRNVWPSGADATIPASTVMYIRQFESYDRFDNTGVSVKEFVVPNGFKIISGTQGVSPWGKVISSFPRFVNGELVSWVSRMTSEVKDNSAMRFVYAIYDPANVWDIKVTSSTSNQVDVASGYTMVGGGVDPDDINGAMNSYPLKSGTWYAESVGGRIVYAVGIKSLNGATLDCNLDIVENSAMVMGQIDDFRVFSYAAALGSANFNRHIVAGGAKLGAGVDSLSYSFSGHLGHYYRAYASYVTNAMASSLSVRTIQCSNVFFTPNPTVIPFWDPTLLPAAATPDPNIAQLGDPCGGDKKYEGPTECDTDLTCAKLGKSHYECISTPQDNYLAAIGEQCGGDKKYNGPTDCINGATCLRVTKKLYQCFFGTEMSPDISTNISPVDGPCGGDKKYDGPTECVSGSACHDDVCVSTTKVSSYYSNDVCGGGKKYNGPTECIDGYACHDDVCVSTTKVSSYYSDVNGPCGGGKKYDGPTECIDGYVCHNDVCV